ncbi:hypothetical protein [Hymenobacter radiodurans]|uniref:hypothetical protein n=1 Tax=Hymenobacter radiodurans TaxID=2496028 RepID=UPI0010585C18|nr:hypothetical protein [Hymenobacter radiodurans]
MAKLKYRGTLNGPNGKVMEVGLSLLSYRDEDLHVIFSPALDMFGYGHTDKEARASFDETLGEFLRYTGNKGSLQNELARLGWKTAGRASNRTYKAPEFSRLLRQNDQLQDIVNHKEFRKYDRKVELPVLA